MAAMDADWRAFHATIACPEPPQGAITAARYAQLNGIREQVAARCLQRAKLKSGLFMTTLGEGRPMRMVRHWWRE
jgi:hypothetical protein